MKFVCVFLVGFCFHGHVFSQNQDSWDLSPEESLREVEQSLLDDLHVRFGRLLEESGYALDEDFSFFSFPVTNYLVAIGAGAGAGAFVGFPLVRFFTPSGHLVAFALGGVLGGIGGLAYAADTGHGCNSIDCALWIPTNDHYRIGVNLKAYNDEGSEQIVSCLMFFSPKEDTVWGGIESIDYEIDLCSDNGVLFPRGGEYGSLRIGDLEDFLDILSGQSKVVLKGEVSVLQ